MHVSFLTHHANVMFVKDKNTHVTEQMAQHSLSFAKAFNEVDHPSLEGEFIRRMSVGLIDKIEQFFMA